MSNDGFIPRSHRDDTAKLWSSDSRLIGFEKVQEKSLPHYGAIVRYRTVMSDGIEREVVYGRALDRLKPLRRSVDLTIGTAPPLSLGPEGMIMHFLLKSMETGLDGIVFGPERTRSDQHLTTAARRRIATQVSLPNTAHACHDVADRLAVEADADLSHMLWAGISLGALKGILFAATAESRGRKMVYSHFVAPVCPNPTPPPSKQEVRKFMRNELGAMIRSSGELMWKDFRDRTFRIHENVARVAQPGLLQRYMLSAPQNSVFRVFTDEWRKAVVTGVAGAGATLLPPERFTTFELFDKDPGGTATDWAPKLERQVHAGTTRIVVNHGRHSDATRLSFQKRRARTIKSVLAAIYNGTPIDELTHPLSDPD